MDAAWLIDHLGLARLPVESTYYVSSYRSAERAADGGHAGTAIIGLLARKPLSRALFHRVRRDELWHFYGGDPLRLVLLHPDGRDGEVVLGPDLAAGHRVQALVPAGTWQAAETLGEWSLFGCNVVPGFSGELFDSGYVDELLARYPTRAEDIQRLGVARGEAATMPHGFI
jgi:predicted cupin superfamily sugar epimerase